MYIYAGEDLPATGDEPKENDATPPHSDERGISTDKSPTIPVPIRQINGISKVQIAQVERLLTETGSDRKKLVEYFGVDTLAEISIADYPRVIRNLEKRRAA